MKKKGFTLVELSIVLVIIGLLIGGILVGQSLIDSAKINQAVRQIQQYDIAVSQFQNKFRQLPGDSNLFELAGNNDGDIAVADTIVGAGVPECGVVPCIEMMSFWKHLTDSGMLKGSYNNDFSSGVLAGLNSPHFFEKQDLAGVSTEGYLSITHSFNDSGSNGSKGWNYYSVFLPRFLAH